MLKPLRSDALSNSRIEVWMFSSEFGQGFSKLRISNPKIISREGLVNDEHGYLSTGMISTRKLSTGKFSTRKVKHEES